MYELTVERKHSIPGRKALIHCKPLFTKRTGEQQAAQKFQNAQKKANQILCQSH